MKNEENRNAESMNYPKNGDGEELPQLIDDILAAREHLLEIRHKTTYSVFICAHLVEAIAHLNRCMKQLNITTE